MKYRKITAVILAVATAICAAGCNGMPVQTSAAHTVIIRILRSGNPCRTI